MAKHAVYSPSSASRWMSCPGSVPLSANRGDKASVFAQEGTAAHFLGAECLLQGVDASYFSGCAIELRQRSDGEHYEAWGQHLPRPDGDTVLSCFAVDDAMTEAVQVYVNYVRDLVASSGGVLFVEVSVPLDHLTGEAEATGTSDAVIVAGEEIIVVDLKFGRGVAVSAEANKQMLMYASGAIRYVDALAGGAEKIKRVRTAISQPRVSSAPSEWTCTIAELTTFEAQVRASANLCADAKNDSRDGDWHNKYLTPSDGACRFCQAAGICPKLAEKVEKATEIDFCNLDERVPDGNRVLSAKLAAVDLVEMWCKSVRAEAESQLLQGHAVPGYKLVQGRMGNRSWVDDTTAESALAGVGLREDQVFERSLITPATAEKVLGKTSMEWARVQGLGIIAQKRGGLSVVPEADKRPPAEPILDGFLPLTNS